MCKNKYENRIFDYFFEKKIIRFAKKLKIMLGFSKGK
jgi:hypothetical protein